MVTTSFYSEDELKNLGLKSYGKNVFISRKCSIYGADRITIGDNVRIDDFVILSIGKSLTINSYVHIGCYASIIGNENVIISDYCGISGRVSIYSSSDDYLGLAMSNPMVPERYTKVKSLPVVLHKHVLVGCGTVILPGAILEEGVAIGALSLVTGKIEGNYVYSGNPLRKIMRRRRKYKEFQIQFEEELNNRDEL